MTTNKTYLGFKDSSIENHRKVSMPSSKNYCEYSALCRTIVDDYFKANFNNFGDIHVEDYFRKAIDIKLLNNYALYHQAKIDYPNLKNISTNDELIDRIIEDKSPSRRFKLVYLLSGIIYLTAYSLRLFVNCLFSKSRTSKPDILYLRKKDYPDLGLGEILSSKINKSTIDSCLVLATGEKSKFKFKLISDYRGSSIRCLRVFLDILMELGRLSKICSFNDIPIRDFHRLVSDSFLIGNIIEIRSLVYTGVLLDKPFYVLLDKYRKPYQAINTINESFFYPPFRTFDYSYADVYYSMNQIDESMQNHFGGNIASFKRVSFFRKDLIINSKGLSDSLKKIKDRFQKIVLATTVQVSDEIFIQFGVEELNSFLYEVKNYASSNPKNLIILKGKKNELSLVDPDIIKQISNLENIFLINSIKPRLLEYDHFEDLIKISDLMISMNHASTTIWQSFAHGKPVIAINDAHPKSFLAGYENLEITSDKLSKGIKFWLEMDCNECTNFIKKISKDVNLGDNDGLSQIANHLERTSNNISARMKTDNERE